MTNLLPLLAGPHYRLVVLFPLLGEELGEISESITPRSNGEFDRVSTAGAAEVQIPVVSVSFTRWRLETYLDSIEAHVRRNEGRTSETRYAQGVRNTCYPPLLSPLPVTFGRPRPQ